MASTKAMKTCFYEVLGVEKTATEKEIERGYKKSALKWHPDKNPGQDTTKMFQDISEAYTVLSDPHERKWYDDHKDQILRGKDVEESKEEDYNYITKSKLWKYFNASCFDGYDPKNEKNFYKVYGDLFYKLDKEEEQEEKVGEEHYDAPVLGDPDYTQEQVFAFYNHWQHFTTKKVFAYADVYNPNIAPNRRVKRIIEIENKKERGTERKEFNDLVIQLVEYVKKRDPRYQKYMVQIAREKQQKQQLLEAEKQKKRLEEQERLRIYREELAQKYAKEEEEALANGEYEEVVVEEFRCQICKKTFKNEKQLHNHLQSKKHKDNAAKFKEHIQLDDETEQVIKNLSEKRQEEEQEDQLLRSPMRRKETDQMDESKEQNQQQDNGKNEEVKKEDDFEQYVSRSKQKKQQQPSKGQNKKGSKKQNNEDDDNEQADEETKEESKIGEVNEKDIVIDEYVSRNKKKKDSKSKNKTKAAGGKMSRKEQEEILNILAEKQNAKKGKKDVIKPKKAKDADDNEESKSQSDTTSQTTTQTKEPKVKEEKEQKETKKEQFEEIIDSELSKKDKRAKKKEKKAQKDSAKNDLICHVCDEEFETRNKMFQHIKQTGHARAV